MSISSRLRYEEPVEPETLTGRAMIGAEGPEAAVGVDGSGVDATTVT
jgi:hypothetical protein